MKKNFGLIISGVLLLVFVFIMINVLSQNILSFDNTIYNFISETCINEKNTPVVIFLTNFGAPIFFIILTLILMLVLWKSKKGLMIALNLINIYVINRILKYAIQRERPPMENRLVEETSFSFPSGHAMVGTTFYAFLIYIIYKDVKNKYLKYGLITFLSFIILSLVFTRVYLGVHYASDVIGGFVIAISYLIIFIKFGYNKFLNRKIGE